MEDNAGYSLVERVDEIIKRRKVTINGKEFALPRNLAERIFFSREKDLRSTKVIFKDNGEIWASYCNGYRYKPTALSSYVSRVISDRYVEDFASQLPSFTGESRNEVDDSSVRQCILAEKSDLQNRAAFQTRLFREFRKKSKF